MSKQTVLFVCVHNAGRSQIAAAYLDAMTDDSVEVLSAGSTPASDINPMVVAAMAEEGIDLAGAQPKILETENIQRSDIVITMGCGDACPIFPGKQYLDWVVDDPANQSIETTRRIRDDIKARVQVLVKQLDSDGAGS